MLSAEANRFLTQTGPGTPMGNLFRSFWTPFLLSKELPEPDCPPVRVTLLGESLVAFRDTNGKVGLMDAHCPHRRAPMFFGRNEECGLRCVYHGWKFDVSGQCVDMPNEPEESRFKEKIKIKSYPTIEKGGVIWAYMGSDEQPPEMPALEFLDLPASHMFIEKVYIHANYMQSMEGDIDSSHVSFLHSTTQNKLASGGGGGIKRDKRLEKFWIESKNPQFFLKEHDHGLLIGARRPATDETYFWRISQWLMPSFTLVAAETDNPIHGIMRVPIDDEHSWQFIIYYHPMRPLNENERYALEKSGMAAPELIPGSFVPVGNLTNDYNIDREAQKAGSFTGIKSLFLQDIAMFEGMGKVIDRTQEHLGTSDAAVIQVRRLLMKAAENLQAGKKPFPANNPEGYRVRSASMEIPKELEFDEGAKEYLNAEVWHS